MSSPDFDTVEFSTWCVSFVAEMLESAPEEIHPDIKFSRVGLDSAMTVQLVVALEERFGLRLNPDVIADHPTITELGDYLATLAAAT